MCYATCDKKRTQKTLSPPRIRFSRKCVTRHLSYTTFVESHGGPQLGAGVTTRRFSRKPGRARDVGARRRVHPVESRRRRRVCRRTGLHRRLGDRATERGGTSRDRLIRTRGCGRVRRGATVIGRASAAGTGTSPLSKGTSPLSKVCHPRMWSGSLRRTEFSATLRPHSLAPSRSSAMRCAGARQSC